MTTGLILLAFLGVIVIVITHRTRRRLGMSTAPKTWAIIMAVFAIVVLGLWSSSR